MPSEPHVIEDDVNGGYQARCARCGWHSYPTAFRKQAQQWADLHTLTVCPNPGRPDA